MLALLAAPILGVTLHAEILPSSRLIDWTPGVAVGVTGGVTQHVSGRTRLIDVTQAPYNADKTGATNASPAINAAIKAAQINEVVYLPAGRYRVDSEITLKHSITLRGAGPDKTTIVPNGGFDVIKLSHYSLPLWVQDQNPVVSSPVTKGTTTFTVSNTADFTVGWIAQVTHAASSDQYDDTIEVSPWSNEGGHGWLRRQKVKVVAKTATTVTVSPGVYGDLPRQVRLGHAQYYSAFVGVEDLMLDMDNTECKAGITFGGLMNSWIKNVKVRGSKNYNVIISDCYQCELRDSHVDELNHVGSSGSGLLMVNSTATLIENNIFTSENSCIQVDHGCAGNVFGYNFVNNTIGSIAINANHGPHNSFNLYEGNISTTFIADGFHGSASHDSLYRNWITTINTGGWGIALKRFTRNYSMVGNIIGAPGHAMAFDGVSLGQPNMGNSSYTGEAAPWADWGKYPGPHGYQELDRGVAASLLRKENYYQYHKGIPAAESLGTTSLPASMYYTAKPTWFGDRTWPAVDPRNPAPTFESIPAGYRYVTGSTLPATEPQPALETQKPINTRVQVATQ